MKKIKFATIIKLVVLIAALGGLTGILSSYSARLPKTFEKERANIVFVYKTMSMEIEFWYSTVEGTKAAAKEFDVDYKIIGPAEESDLEGNIKAVAEAIEMRPDVIVLTATDYERLAPAAESILDAGILLMTMDSDVAGGISRCFVATDNVMLGRLMGEEMSKRVPADGKVGIVAHIKGSGTAIERISGATDVLGGASGRVLEPVYCDNHTGKSLELTLEMIAQNPDLTGIIATNEISGLGVASAVMQLGLQDVITVVTCDNSSRQITFLEQGAIDVTVTQKPFNMGYMSVELATRLLRGDDTVPRFFDTGCEVITRENMFSIENQKLLFPFRE